MLQLILITASLLVVPAVRFELDAKQEGIPAPNGLFCPIGCMKTRANNFAEIATAIGFNTSAGGKASFAMGVNTRTISDPNVPGGGSCGGCVSMGFETTTMGDWTTAMGSHTTARGYASTAMGEGTVANTFGEVALGLYTETGNYSEEELQNQSVIPTFDEKDVVLRVGIGCPKSGQLDAGGFGCKTNGPLDALRVYKSGALYLKKHDGSVVEDVQASLEKCQTDYSEMRAELTATKLELDTVKTTLSEVLARLAALEGKAPGAEHAAPSIDAA